jgi:hypothetical protein
MALAIGSTPGSWGAVSQRSFGQDEKSETAFFWSSTPGDTVSGLGLFAGWLTRYSRPQVEQVRRAGARQAPCVSATQTPTPLAITRLFAPDSVVWRVPGDLVTAMLGIELNGLFQTFPPAIGTRIYDHDPRLYPPFSLRLFRDASSLLPVTVGSTPGSGPKAWLRDRVPHPVTDWCPRCRGQATPS